MFSKYFMNKEERRVWPLSLLALGAVVGLLASFVLSTEAIDLAKNSQVELPCSLNAVINCAAVGLHPTAHVFGFPNAFIGMMTLPVMLTIAVAALMGTKFPKSFMFMAELGAIVGVVFAGWMFLVSYNVIEILCPWCLTVDAAMLVIFLALTHYNIREGNLYLNDKMDKFARSFVSKGFDILFGVITIFACIAAVVLKFGQALWG